MGHGLNETHGKLGAVSGWSEEEGARPRPRFDVCGFVGMVGIVGYLWPWA